MQEVRGSIPRSSTTIGTKHTNSVALIKRALRTADPWSATAGRPDRSRVAPPLSVLGVSIAAKNNLPENLTADAYGGNPPCGQSIPDS